MSHTPGSLWLKTKRHKHNVQTAIQWREPRRILLITTPGISQHASSPLNGRNHVMTVNSGQHAKEITKLSVICTTTDTNTCFVEPRRKPMSTKASGLSLSLLHKGEALPHEAKNALPQRPSKQALACVAFAASDATLFGGIAVIRIFQYKSLPTQNSCVHNDIPHAPCKQCCGVNSKFWRGRFGNQRSQIQHC